MILYLNKQCDCICFDETDYSADEHIEYEPYDGWYNNFAHPDWGAAGIDFCLSLSSADCL